MHRFHMASARLTTISLHARLCSFGLSAKAGKLFAAFDREIGWLDTESGRFVTVLAPELPPGVRFNDGWMGPDGAFWVGSMVEDEVLAGGGCRGALYRIAPDMVLSVILTGIGISNGLCWSPDGAVTDISGQYVSALWDEGSVGVFDPDGRLRRQIKVPASRVTCPAFGGDDMRFLAVTTARVGLSGDQLSAQPAAGNVFIYHAPVGGVPERQFQGDVPPF